MRIGRLKELISFPLAFFLIANLNLAALAQSISDAFPNPASNLALKNPADSKATGIETVPGRMSPEGAGSADRVWQMTGPFGGDVASLAIDPRNPDRILIGANDGQIYRSTDGGVIWKRVRPGIKASGFTVTVIHFDREKADLIYAGIKAVTALGEETNGGSLFASEDNGENWREVEGMHGRAIRSLVQSAKDPQVLVAAALDGVYRSIDHGKLWERITPTDDPELRNFHSIAVDPRDGDRIYVGTSHLPWKTIDGGKNWKRAGDKERGMIDDSDIMAIHIDEANPDTVLMSACSGIYRSLDASAKWTKIQGIPYTSRRTHVIYQHPTKPEVIFAGTTEGLWLSTNGGKPDSWRRVTSLRLVINAIAVHPDRPDRVFLGTEDNGVLISNDGGESYETSNAGFINRQVRAVLADRKERGRIYAGVIFDSANGGLFISEDGGMTWQQSMNGMGVRDVYSLYQSPAHPDTLYAGTNHGIFRSDDQGRNWEAVKKAEPLEAPAGEDPGAAEKSAQPKTSDQPQDQSPDQPANQPPANGSRPRRVTSSPSATKVRPIVQARAKSGARKSKSGKAAPGRSNKQAKAKIKKPAPPPPAVVSDLVDLQSQVFAIIPFTPRREAAEGETAANPGASNETDPASAHSLLASTWDGLFRTDDEKKGWKQLKLRSATEGDAAPPRQPRIKTIAASPHAPGLIFVGTEEGLFISRDNGVTFNLTLLNDEVRRVRDIAFDPRAAETIYLGTSTGFFRSIDGGQTWEQRGGGMPLSTDISVIMINSLNPDELYIGDDLRACFFHSKDRGKNWEKVDLSQLPSVKIWSLASDPFEQNKFYAGSFSGGVYVTNKK